MKFCTCTPKLSRNSYNHVAGCEFYKVKPETKDEKIARLEAQIQEMHVSETLLHILLERNDVPPPVEVSVETYDDPPVRIMAKVWTHRKSDGIVWCFGRVQSLSQFTRECDESMHRYMHDLCRKANTAYEKAWSGK